MIEVIELRAAIAMAAAPYWLLALLLAWYVHDAVLLLAEGLGGVRRWGGVAACLGLDVACCFFVAVVFAGLLWLSDTTRDAAVIYDRIHPGDGVPQVVGAIDMLPVTVLLAVALVLTAIVRDRRGRRPGEV